MLTLTYISALAASFLWSATVFDGYRASSKIISKPSKIREEFLPATESRRASIIRKGNISNSRSTIQGGLIPELTDLYPKFCQMQADMIARGFLNFYANSEPPEIPTYVTLEEA